MTISPQEQAVITAKYRVLSAIHDLSTSIILMIVMCWLLMIDHKLDLLLKALTQ